MNTRVNTLLHNVGTVNLFITDCGNCGVIFAMTNDYDDRRRSDGKTFYCPNGHPRVYRENDTTRLAKATARETHLKDQLSAATRNEEAARSELLRIRSRIAAGICPCCRRTFQNVARHIETQHPDFTTPTEAHGPTSYRCTCGKKFGTFRGLRTHQGHMRPDDWDAPGKSRTSTWDGAHLTETASR